jgi:56kDa selenium binding protein (SBP56)
VLPHEDKSQTPCSSHTATLFSRSSTLRRQHMPAFHLTLRAHGVCARNAAHACAPLLCSQEGYVGCALSSTMVRFFRKDDGTWDKEDSIVIPPIEVRCPRSRASHAQRPLSSMCAVGTAVSLAPEALGSAHATKAAALHGCAAADRVPARRCVCLTPRHCCSTLLPAAAAAAAAAGRTHAHTPCTPARRWRAGRCRPCLASSPTLSSPWTTSTCEPARCAV